MEKKEKIKIKINEYINTVVDKAAIDGTLGHLEVEIKIHQDDIQMNSTTKTREKVY